MKRLFILSALLILCVGCEGIFFYPGKALLYHPEICAERPQNFYIDTADGVVLHSWLFRTPWPKPKGTIIFMHGNSRNMSSESIQLLWVLAEGYNLFTFDYRGYGISTGSPSIKGVLLDAVEAIDGFMQISDIDKNNLILYGQSLGGAAVSYAAANSPHASKFKILVLDSTFTSWKDIAVDTGGPFGLFYPDKMAALDSLPKSQIENTLIIHSKKDKFIKISHSERLFEAAKEPKTFFVYDYAGHAKILTNPLNIPKIKEYFDTTLN